MSVLKDSYQEIIKLPVEIRESVFKNNEKRNSLHFMTEEKGVYNKERVNELRNLIQFVKFDLAVLQNEMVNLIGESPLKKIKVSVPIS